MALIMSTFYMGKLGSGDSSSINYSKDIDKEIDEFIIFLQSYNKFYGFFNKLIQKLTSMKSKKKKWYQKKEFRSHDEYYSIKEKITYLRNGIDVHTDMYNDGKHYYETYIEIIKDMIFRTFGSECVYRPHVGPDGKYVSS
jgi:hypothetical protein